MQIRLIAGRYQLNKLMRHVSEAQYYEAMDIITAQPVALRIIDMSEKGKVGIGLEHLASQKRQMMVENEKRIINQLHHPSLLEIIDHGVDNSIYYHVYPAFVFESLHTRLEQNQPLPIREGLKYIGQAAEGLAYLHDKDIVHCDVSAENLLVIENQIKIIEFSIANRELPEGIVTGDPPYMSPEAIAGARPAPARDVWALGVTMVYILTGEFPFGNLGFPRAQSVPALFEKISRDPPNISNTYLPPQLTKLIEQMLEKNPSERIHDMRVVASEIEAVIRLPRARS